jgi:hypothetical protein
MIFSIKNIIYIGQVLIKNFFLSTFSRILSV